jgi:hypothetical protein
MTRLLALGVFAFLHAIGAVAAFHCYDPVCTWMNGGYWVSPAVRVPVVVTGVVLSELLLLSLVTPCHRLVAGLFGCQSYPHATSTSGRLATPTR